MGIIKLKFLEQDGGMDASNMLFTTYGVEIDFTQSKNGLFNFGVVEIDSSKFRDGKLADKTILIEVHESNMDKRGNLITGCIG